MYKAIKSGFFVLSCQSRSVKLEAGKQIPGDISSDSIVRLLQIGAIEKVSDDFVQETKPSKEKKETKTKASGEKKDHEGDKGGKVDE